MSYAISSFSDASEQSSLVEADLSIHLERIHKQFQDEYGVPPDFSVQAPGRAEIIGNHTDYNGGYAIACAISQSVIALFRKRDDAVLQARSLSYPSQKVLLELEKLTPSENEWGRYLAGVAAELIAQFSSLHGADILIDTSIPSTGGVSSSAAFETAMALGLLAVNQLELPRIETALLCKRAENGPFVNTPCGLLDQATVMLSETGRMVFFDFMAEDESKIRTELIDADLHEAGLQFVITLDPEVKRNLGETGYPARRKMCEESLPILSKLLGRPLSFLREVGVADFNQVKEALQDKGGEEMRKRVEHVVFENDRVLQATHALDSRDFTLFGKLLTESGRSALELYELDAQTPELTFLVEKARPLPGVIGTRNMGGGFSAVTLSLVEEKRVEHIEQHLQDVYQAQFGRPLSFIRFTPASHAQLLPSK